MDEDLANAEEVPPEWQEVALRPVREVWPQVPDLPLKQADDAHSAVLADRDPLLVLRRRHKHSRQDQQ